MRKDAGFNVTDHIEITITGSEKVVNIALKKSTDISKDTLADSLDNAATEGFVKEWDINGETVNIGVKRV